MDLEFLGQGIHGPGQFAELVLPGQLQALAQVAFGQVFQHPDPRAQRTVHATGKHAAEADRQDDAHQGGEQGGVPGGIEEPQAAKVQL